jgi:small subunit ribosomal protein S15
MKKKLDEKLNEIKIHETDTGSSGVQIMLLTERINELNNHIKIHKKDFSTKRGLMKLVGRRHRLSLYLKRKNVNKYKEVIALAGLRK